MSAPTVTESTDLATFLQILEQIPVGTEFHIEHIRTELEAAQIRPSQYGPLFGAAERRGLCRSTGRAYRCKKPSRRGGWAGIYVRTNP